MMHFYENKYAFCVYAENMFVMDSPNLPIDQVIHVYVIN